MGCCSSSTPQIQDNTPWFEDPYEYEENNLENLNNSQKQEKEVKEVPPPINLDQQSSQVVSSKRSSIKDVQSDDEKNKSIIPEYKFKKQLANLKQAMDHAFNLQKIPQNGRKVTQAIAELGFVNQILALPSQQNNQMRKFKTDMIHLYSDLHMFRAFHLRYIVDEEYYTCLTAITELNHLVKESYVNHTKNGNTDFEAISTELKSDHSFAQVSSRMSNVQAQYKKATGQNFSKLPNYLYVTFSDQRGFPVWTQLFPTEFEVSNQHFAEKYSQYCGVEQKDIIEVFSILDNSNDKRVDIYQWMQFVQDYEPFLNNQDQILPSKLHSFQSEIQSHSQAMNIPPQKISNGQYKLPSGMIFTGEIDSNQRRQGKGTLKDEEYSFEGTFQNDVPSGHGKEVRKNVIYEGQFFKGLYHGLGKLTFPNGRRYVGNFQHHLYHGEGELFGDDGIKYEGTWKQGILDYGKITYHDGSYYIGSLGMNFFKHGKGQYYMIKPSLSTNSSQSQKIIPYVEGNWERDSPVKAKVFNFKEAEMYEGAMQNWAISGRGRRTYEEGSYEGELLTDKKNNQGKIIYNNGDQFSGSWRDDQYERGIYTFGDNPNHFYEGDFRDGKLQGKGKMTYPSGGVYEGDVVNGQREGRGIYIFKNGHKYEGFWANNKQDGEGLFIYKDNNGEVYDIYSGEFKEGKYCGFGHYYYSDSRKSYIGYWDNDKWNGEGKYYEPDGSISFAGVWNDDHLESHKNESEIIFPASVEHLILQNLPHPSQQASNNE